MARLEQTYYSDQLPRSSDIAREPVPAGTYEVQITDTDLKTTKNGDGCYIWLELTIVKNPEYNDRKIFANINISNPSQRAVDIGRAQLGDVLEITGISMFNDTDMLKGKLLGVKVKVQEGTPEHPNKQNNVTQFLYPDGTPVGRGKHPQAIRAAQPDAPVERKRERPF